jgi:hypothetical protein
MGAAGGVGGVDDTTGVKADARRSAETSERALR